MEEESQRSWSVAWRCEVQLLHGTRVSGFGARQEVMFSTARPNKHVEECSSGCRYRGVIQRTLVGEFDVCGRRRYKSCSDVVWAESSAHRAAMHRQAKCGRVQWRGGTWNAYDGR